MLIAEGHFFVNKYNNYQLARALSQWFPSATSSMHLHLGAGHWAMEPHFPSACALLLVAASQSSKREILRRVAFIAAASAMVII